MIYFLDTSALLKRYLPEEGSEVVRRLFRRSVEIAAARVTEAEAYAAVARVARDGGIDEEDRERVFDALAEDLLEVRTVEVRQPVVRLVRGLVTRWPLRGYDAVQLGCAMRLSLEGRSIDFWTCDKNLAAAARGEGMRATLV